MLFKILRLLPLLSLFLLPISSFAETYLPAIQEIVKKGKLVVSVNKYDYPPMFWKNEQGELVGYDIDLANYLGENLGVPVEFVRTARTFDEVVEVVSNGEADIAVSLLTPNLKRARTVFFTQPYLYLDELLVYNRLIAAQHKLSDPANQIQNIKNIKIGALVESSYVDYVHKFYPQATVVSFENLMQALTAVKEGEIFGYFDDSASVSYSLEKNDAMSLYVGVSQLKDKEDPIAIAVSMKYPDLVEWINLALTLRKSTNIGDAEVK